MRRRPFLLVESSDLPQAEPPDLAADRSTSGQIATGGSVTSRLEQAGDRDWFAVTLNAGQIYSFALTGTVGSRPGLAQPVLGGLFDSAGGQIARGGGRVVTEAGGTAELRVEVARSGRYFVDVGGLGDATGSYDLTLARATLPQDLPAGPSTTAVLDPEDGVETRLGTPRDVDWFRFTIGRQLTVVLSADAVGLPGRALLDPRIVGVYDSRGSLLPRTSVTDSNSRQGADLTFKAPSPGDYFLAVGSETGSGLVRAGIAPLPVFSPDAVPADPLRAAPMSLAEAVEGRIDQPGDVDRFQVRLQKGQSYLLSLTGAETGDGSLERAVLMPILGPGLDPIVGTGQAPGFSKGGAASTQFIARTTGSYVFGVTSVQADTGTYQLDLTRLDLRVLQETPDNGSSNAMVAPGSPHKNVIAPPGDIDAVWLNVKAGTEYSVRVDGQSVKGKGSLAEPSLTILTGDVGTAEVKPASPFQVESAFGSILATKTGKVLLQIGGQKGGTGSYTVSVQAEKETTPPVVTSFYPGKDGTALPKDVLILNFNNDDTLLKGDGSFILRRLSGAQQLEDIKIPAKSPAVSMAGDLVFIDPPQDLKPNFTYKLIVGKDAIRDGIGNPTKAQDLGNFEVETATPSQNDWTVIFYSATDNNLEGTSYLLLNAVEGVTRGPRVEAYAMIDRAPGFLTNDFGGATIGDWTEARQGTIITDADPLTSASADGAKRTLSSLGEVNTGNPALLTQLIKAAAKTHPAEHYALVLYDHGGGLYGGMSDDSSGGDGLSMLEIRKGIDDAGIFLDSIIYDACSMAMVEVLFAHSGQTDYVVASQAIVPFSGLDTAGYMQRLASQPATTGYGLGFQIVDDFEARYTKSEPTADVTLSLSGMSRLDDLELALDSFVTAALALPVSSLDWSAMNFAAAGAKDASGPAQFRDLQSFAENVAAIVKTPALKSAATALAQQTDLAVFDSQGTMTGVNGLSIYLPTADQPIDPGYVAGNQPFLQAVAWDDFLAKLTLVA